MASLAGRGRERLYVREYEIKEERGGERKKIGRDKSVGDISVIGNKRKAVGNDIIEVEIEVEDKVELGVVQIVKVESEVVIEVEVESLLGGS